MTGLTSDVDVLRKSTADFASPAGSDLLARTEAFFAYYEARRAAAVWPYSRSMSTPVASTAAIKDDAGRSAAGINFASQDYLSLSSHPLVHEAAKRALRDFGPHSAGSPCLLGNSVLSLELERALADLTLREHVLLYPTGWAAGFGAIAGLIRRHDHVVLDELAHACLQQGAQAATRSVVRHAHLDVDDARTKVKAIRARDAKNGVLVVTEGLFSMDSDTPDLRALQEMCRELGATLLVDVAHDLGALGPRGTGRLGEQGVLGDIDLVMGSFSKTFASNGGFVACGNAAVKQFLKIYGGSHTFSNALSPMQAGIVLEAMRIVRSEEGERLRAQLRANAERLRGGLAARAIHCLGEPSAIVAVPIGDEAVARVASRFVFERNVLANLVEYPAVASGAARFRMQVMAKHHGGDITEAVRVVAEAIAEARSAVGPVNGYVP